METFLAKSPAEQREEFFAVTSPRDVAKLLEIDYGRLVFHLYKIPREDKYKSFQIPKKSGGVREILAPISSLKIIQRKLNEILLNVYQPKPSVFSYVARRNIVKNARKHQRQKYVFNVDLIDFFQEINFGRVRGLFIGKPYNLPENAATVLAKICCFDNQLPQGAPTSPIVSNMICGKMDSELQELARVNKCIYTRYADDITFSTSLKEFPAPIAFARSATDVAVGDVLRSIIEQNGFRVNEKKIRLQPWYRRQQVTGLTVNKFPNVRRRYVRQIRAMLHAWDKYGIAKAEKEFFEKYDDKYRNEELAFPSFRQVLRGRIDFLGMVRGHKNQNYRRFISEFNRIKLRDKGIPSLRIFSLEEIDKPIVYTEGMTDEEILTCAWKKLFPDSSQQFLIRRIDPLGSFSPEGGSGGVRAITNMLNSRRSNSTNFVVGLYDRDDEGIKEYYNKLHKDYVEYPEEDWKISLPRKSGALLLPIPEGKERYAELCTLCIEFYFNDAALELQTPEGFGLSIDYLPAKIKTVHLKASDETKLPEARIIKDGKKVFATKIVPTLEKDEFANFKPLFIKLIQLINAIQSETQAR